MNIRKYISWLLFILVFSSPLLNAQDILFKKYLSLSPRGVTYLGDQNSDGYDDFLIYDCNLHIAYIYFGSNAIDTIPKLVIKNLPVSYIKALDANNDGKLDIIAGYLPYSGQNKVYMRVYYGGQLLDAIPDIVFSGPAGSKDWGWPIHIINDYDGDGHSELLVCDPFLPNSYLQYGSFYFYKTYPQLNIIPAAVLYGDSATHLRINTDLGKFSSGDLNGDGMTDFSISAYIDTGTHGLNDLCRMFYLGNQNFDFTPAVTYYRSRSAFDPEYMQIIKDVNGDRRDDILIKSYGNYYPYYYRNSILYGNFPIDTIPKVGLNTQNTIIRFEYPVISSDFNRDGYNDFLTRCGGSILEARVWFGRADMNKNGFELPMKRWGGGYDMFGTLTGKVGDVNGDGIEDYCVGSSSAYYCVPGDVLILKGDTLYKDTTAISSVDDFTELTGFYLSSAYPNPFNNQVNINYNLAKESEVILQITNSIGQELKTINKGILSNGSYNEHLDLTGYSSGIYFITLIAQKGGSLIFSKTEKISLIK